jgi:hypothetical protein
MKHYPLSRCAASPYHGAPVAYAAWNAQCRGEQA